MDPRVVRRAVAGLFLVPFVLGACDKPQAAAGGGAAGSGASQAAAPVPPPPPAAAEPLTDARILKFLDLALLADSAGAALGADHGAFPSVQRLGAQNRSELRGLRAAVAQTMTKVGGTAEAVTGGDLGTLIANENQHLGALSILSRGVGWDAEYLDSTTVYQQRLLDLSQRLLDSADSPETKALIGRVQPILRNSVTRGKDIRKREFGR